MKTLIKNANIVRNNDVCSGDVLIENGRIAAIGNLSDSDATIIDATGLLLFPGFIDPHTHFDLPLGGDLVTADDFATGSKAALLGGTTTVIDFATQDMDGSLIDALNQWKKKAEKSATDYAFHMAIARWDEGVKAEIDTMVKEGVTSAKMYMVYAMRVSDEVTYEALSYMKDKGMLLSMHCENFGVLSARISEQKALGNGDKVIAHAHSRPSLVEAEAVSRFIRIAKMADAPCYVVHLSTAEGLFDAKRAIASGQKVYLETCPQYLLLDESRYLDDDAEKFVMSPPLRSKFDNEQLFAGLSDGSIHTIGTDHCSFTMAQKKANGGDFTKIPNGGASVQLRAQLLYTYGVCENRISLSQMAKLLSTKAAEIFGLANKGRIEVGADADIVLFDPEHNETITHKNLAHNCDNTPFEGFDVRGRALHVFLRGEHVVDGGVCVNDDHGRYVKRGASGTV